MSIHRSTSFDRFVKLVDSALLRQYLQKTKALPENDARELTVESVDKLLSSLFDKTIAIDIEDDLLCMDDITDSALYGLHDIAKKYGIPAKADEAPQNIAMRVFLHQSDAFEKLYDSYICKTCYDKLSYFPVKTEKANYGEEAFEAFKKAIAESTQNQKPEECIVRHHEYKGDQYVLITRLDKAHSYRTLASGRLRPRTYRPAKEDAVYYNQKRGIIGVSSGFRGAAAKKLCVRAFAKAVLNVQVVDDKVFSSENGLMTLAPMKTTEFYKVTEQITKIELLCAEYAHKATHLADICISSDEVRTTVKELSFPEANCEFISAKVRFTLKDHARTQTVHITKKGFTALKNHAARETIEAYLRDQKVVLF